MKVSSITFDIKKIRLIEYEMFIQVLSSYFKAMSTTENRVNRSRERRRNKEPAMVTKH